MIVRDARVADADEIAGITNAIIRDTLITFTTAERQPSDIAEEITHRGNAFWVAEADGHVMGFATYSAFRGGPGYRYTAEHSIQIADAARGQGVGRALMQRLEQGAIQNGIHVLVAGISSANPGAVSFHAALGFRQVGHMPGVGFKSGQWLDLVLMQKNLAAHTKA